MKKTFEQVVLEIKESIDQSVTPTQLTSVLMMCLKQAEDFEDEWINELYENSEDGFSSLVY
jgi:hypothetical protein